MDDKSKAELPAPMALAMVLCDHVHVDRATGKRSLMGLFSVVRAFSFPSIHPNLGIYAALTDGYGRADIVIDLIDAAEALEPVTLTQGQIEFPDPRSVIEMSFNSVPLQFPAPSEYRLRLFSNRELIIERRIVVTQLDPESAP